MRVLDLFSGIGGFSLGLERAGMATVAFCESDQFCQAVLAKHWPHIRIHDNIHSLNGGDYFGKVEVVCGGFPCQPFSSSGLRRGASDDRYLWPEMFRVIRESRPDWVIGENVSAFARMGLDEMLSDLEEEKYTSRSFIIPACGVDAPHRRNRVWVVAHANHKGQRADQRGRGKGDYARSDGKTTSGPRSLDTDKARWSDEPRICRISHGLPNRLDRIKALGNSLVPQIAEQIGHAIIEIERGKDVDCVL